MSRNFQSDVINPLLTFFITITSTRKNFAKGSLSYEAMSFEKTLLPNFINFIKSILTLR